MDPKTLLNGKTAGLIRGMSFLDYQKLQAVNWSRIFPYLKSAAHGKDAEAKADDETFLDVGQALHRAVLEPALFEGEFGAIPEDAPVKRGKDNLAWWAAFEAANAGKTMLKPSDLEVVRRGAEAVYAHPRMNAMLNDPKATREVVALAMDPEFGIWRKARLDLLAPWRGKTTIVDLKSMYDASMSAMERAMDTEGYGSHGYVGQLAFYRETLNLVAPYDRACAMFAVSKDPVFSVVYDVDEAALEVGAEAAALALRRFVESNTAQRWPGYPDATVSLKPWRLKRGDR